MQNCLPISICLSDLQESRRYRRVCSPMHNCGLRCARPGRLAPFGDWECPLKLQKAFISPASLCRKNLGLKYCIYCWDWVAKLGLKGNSRQSERLNLPSRKSSSGEIRKFHLRHQRRLGKSWHWLLAPVGDGHLLQLPVELVPLPRPTSPAQAFVSVSFCSTTTAAYWGKTAGSCHGLGVEASSFFSRSAPG